MLTIAGDDDPAEFVRWWDEDEFQDKKAQPVKPQQVFEWVEGLFTLEMYVKDWL